MKRVTLIVGIAVFGLGGLAAGLSLSEVEQAPANEVVAEPAPAPLDDPCAQYIAQGIACEFVAFPEMEITPSVGGEVARR